MGTTTEYLPAPISGQRATSDFGFHPCTNSKIVPIPWKFRRRSISLCLCNLSNSQGNTLGMTSSPSSPLSFLPEDDNRRRDSLWGDSLLSPASSGYSSESSEGDASSETSSTLSCSLSSLRDITLTDLQGPRSSHSTNSTVDASNSSPKQNTLHILGASPLSETSSIPESLPSIPEGGLTTVTVPSKRSFSESSSSSSGDPSTGEESLRRRVKDNEGFIRRAACVCVNEDESKVVLITSKTEGGGWLVPGGGLESGEGEVEAAVREAWEEAGITGNVKRCLGVFQSEDEMSHKKKRTAVYVMSVEEQHSDYPEVSLGRVREWFPIDSALEHLSQCKPHQMAYLRAL